MAVRWSYYDNATVDEINDKYLPWRGEGDTLATQIVTATNKLIYKWYNDGDAFDNTEHLVGFGNDLSSYANWLNTHSIYGGILDGVFECKSESDYEDLLKEFSDKVFNLELLDSLNKLPADGTIYKCKGKFKFIDRSYDDDDGDDDWYCEDDEDEEEEE